MEKALDMLGRDPVLLMGMIDPLVHGDARLVCRAPGGVLIQFQGAGIYMLWAEGMDDARALLDQVGPCENLACYRRDQVEAAREKLGFTQGMACFNAVYMKKERARYAGLHTIRPLTMDHLATVLDHYKSVSDPNYAAGRIQAGEMWGAFGGNELMGFIGLHDERSIGLLEVLPQHRRKRVGAELEAFLINHLLDRGRVPFCQVVDGNTASLALQRSLGMAISQGHMYWVF